MHRLQRGPGSSTVPRILGQSINPAWLKILVIVLLSLALGWHAGRSGAGERRGAGHAQGCYGRFAGCCQLWPGVYGRAAVANLTRFKKELLSKTELVLAANRNHELVGPKRFDLYTPIVSCPPGQALAAFGNGTVILGEADGHKRLCLPLLPPSLASAEVASSSASAAASAGGDRGSDGAANSGSQGCVVYSMGSNGQFEFEQEVLRTTPCSVFSFDCTSPGRSLDPTRHTYHHACVSDPDTAAMFTNFSTYETLTQALGHSSLLLLKVDIEGHELGMFASWRHTQPPLLLPLFLAVEIHSMSVSDIGKGIFTPRPGQEAAADRWMSHLGRGGMTQEGLSLMFMHLAELGYAIVSREDNPLGTFCCSEYLFVRVVADGNQP